MFDSDVFLKNITTLPGVYSMYGDNHQLIYVGKARNLKKRLSSYFNNSKKSAKTQSMVEQIRDIQVTITASEAEALLLECQLIKEYHPKYNILMRDDKTYPYIVLTSHSYPRLDVYRGAKHKKAEFYGPFPSATAVKQTIKLIQKIYQLRSCRDRFFALRDRPCLQYQIGRCSAPCVKKITEEDYQESVKQVRLLLQGKSETVINEIIQDMDKAAEAHAYEKAAIYRDKITHIRHIQSLQASAAVDNYHDIFEAIISQKKQYYLQREMLRDMFGLIDMPQRIECFDISHMQGEAIVASCVVFNSEGPLKQDYRRFSISDITPGDDYAAMRQALERRYSRILLEEAALPDLIIIDGGQGQLTIAEQVLSSLHCGHIALISISKGPERRPGHETIWMAKTRQVLHFDLNHPGFLLIQQIRDEAHRFAVAGHQMARKKKRLTSVLENIPGIGPKRRRDLLRHFGGLQGLDQASEKDIANVSRIGAGLAKVIFEHLHGS